MFDLRSYDLYHYHMQDIDPASPVPLYHQIAQVIRARIQGGELAPGDILEPLREAAAEWQVNFHTVRHAYAELAREGLVEMRGPRGTHVIGTGGPVSARAPRAGARRDVESFLDETLRRARTDFGLSARELADRLTRTSAEAPSPRVYVLECSEHQCRDLGRQIESSWRVEAVPWCLDRQDAPPGEDLVATHFHYNEIRLRWPERLAKTLFVPISPAPALRSQIERRLGGRSNASLTLCERDEPTAAAVAADLSVVLPASAYALRTALVELAPRSRHHASDPFEGVAGDLLLLPPRIWGSLTAEERANDRLVEVRYLYDRGVLEETAARLGWAPND